MIQVKLNQQEYRRVLKALKKVRYRIAWWMQADGGEMNRRCAIGYTQLLVKNIMGLTRPSPPYVPRYRAWKLAYGRMGYPAPWRLFGDLLKNVTFFKSGTGWMGGVPANVYDTGGKSWFGKGDKGRPKKIAMYARVSERRRPIFRLTMEEFASSAWPKQGGFVLQDIRGAWS